MPIKAGGTIFSSASTGLDHICLNFFMKHEITFENQCPRQHFYFFTIVKISEVVDILAYQKIVFFSSLRSSICLHWCAGASRLPSQTQAETFVHVKSWCRCRARTSSWPSQTRTLWLWWERPLWPRGGRPGSTRTQPSTRHQQKQWVSLQLKTKLD